MTDRIDAVESRMNKMENGLEDVKQEMKQRFEGMKQIMLAEMARQAAEFLIGKKAGEHMSGSKEGSERNSLGNTATAVNERLDEFRLSAKKVELLAFDGTNPVAWVMRAETYFEVQKTSEDMRIQLAKLSMEGLTIHWFNLWKESTEEISWENFKDALVARLDNSYEELKEMRLRGTVEEYILEFELYSSQCGKLHVMQFLGYFIGGLRHEIRSRVRTLKPRNNYQAMHLARDIEAELQIWDEVEDDDMGKSGNFRSYSRRPEFQSGMRNAMGPSYSRTVYSQLGSQMDSSHSRKSSGAGRVGSRTNGSGSSSGSRVSVGSQLGFNYKYAFSRLSNHGVVCAIAGKEN